MISNLIWRSFLFSPLLMAGCTDSGDLGQLDKHNQEQTQSSQARAVQVTDFKGNIVKLAKPAEKIVALSPHIVENVFSAGAGEQLIGVVTYSNYPEQAKSLPIVGSYAKANYEKIVELDPDLIVSWESGNTSASIARFKELGFTVYIDQPSTLRDIAKSIRDIGELTGHKQQANKTADDYLLKIDQLEQRYQSVIPITTFYQVWNQPLQTINRNSIISDAIKLCGGENIYADEPVIGPVINIESVLDRNPQAIIASGMSESRPEWLDDWKQWDSLKAVQENNLFFVPPDHIQRHTLRLLLGVETICQQLATARLHSSSQ